MRNTDKNLSRQAKNIGLQALALLFAFISGSSGNGLLCVVFLVVFFKLIKHKLY